MNWGTKFGPLMSPDATGGGLDEGETEVETPDPSEERLRRLEENAQVNQLLADPEIRAVIEARQAGKRVKVTSDEGETEPEAEAPIYGDLAEDDPIRKTLEQVDKLISTKLDRVLGPLAQRLAGVENLATEVKAKDLKTEVRELRGKYQDFNEYGTKMMDLAKAQPGLGVEELYLLAKHRSGKLSVSKPSTFSEKPTSQVSARTSKPTRKPTDPPRSQGRKGWNEILGEALGRLDLSQAE